MSFGSGRIGPLDPDFQGAQIGTDPSGNVVIKTTGGVFVLRPTETQPGTSTTTNVVMVNPLLASGLTVTQGTSLWVGLA